MISFSSLRADLTIHLNLETPILNWQDVPAKFFRMIYDALSPKINVSTRDLSISSTTVLGDAWVRYALFGGNSTIAMHPDRVVIQFSRLQPGDFQIALDVTNIAHDSIASTFPEMRFSSLQYRSYEHLSLGSVRNIDRFLKRFSISKVSHEIESNNAIYEPEVKFRIVVPSLYSTVNISAERSLLADSSIFTALDISVQNVGELNSFQDKYERTRVLIKLCLDALALKPVEA